MTKISYIRGIEPPRQFQPGNPTRLDLLDYAQTRQPAPAPAKQQPGGLILGGLALLLILSLKK